MYIYSTSTNGQYFLGELQLKAQRISTENNPSSAGLGRVLHHTAKSRNVIQKLPGAITATLIIYLIDRSHW